MTEREKQVFDALSAQCAKREYCTADVRRKARQRLEFDAAAAEAAKATPEGRPIFFSTLMRAARDAMRDDVMKAMKTFAKVD